MGGFVLLCIGLYYVVCCCVLCEIGGFGFEFVEDYLIMMIFNVKGWCGMYVLNVIVNGEGLCMFGDFVM